MKTLTRTIFNGISQNFYRNEKLSLYFLSPLKAGFFGFSTIMIILFICDIFSSVLGIGSIALNGIDIVLAGVGFVLKFGEHLLKNFGG